jgi:hypothetical protein
VLKAFDVIKNERLEYDASWNDLTQLLMSIQKTTTNSGHQTTCTAGH